MGSVRYQTRKRVTTRMTVLQISKLDAAKRNLEQALLLFFESGDVVATHVLASAAREVLRQLAKPSGVKSLNDILLEHIKPGKTDEVLAKLNEANNFFKHAGRDSGKVIEFNPESTEFILWDATTLYQRLVGELPSLVATYLGWFVLKRKNIFMDDQTASQATEIATHLNLDLDNRSNFLRIVRSVIDESRAQQ